MRLRKTKSPNVTMRFQKTKSAGYLANHMARLFAIGLGRRIQPLKLAPAQFMTLHELVTKDGLTQKELVDRLDVEQATMANTLARMARDQLITRKPHPSDARAQQVWITPKGRSLEQLAIIEAQAQNEMALADLSGPEKAMFIELMRRVIDTMRSNYAE